MLGGLGLGEASAMAVNRRVAGAVLMTVSIVAVVVTVGACVWFFGSPGSEPPQPPAPPPTSTQRTKQSFEVAEVVFDSGLGKGWEDWGWGPRDKGDSGALRVGFAGYGGVIFHHSELDSPYGALVFRFRAPQSFGDFLAVSLKYAREGEQSLPEVTVEPRHIVELDGGWSEVMVPLLALNPGRGPFDRIVIRAREMVSSDWVEIDKVVLTKAIAEPDASAPARLAKLSIDCRGTATAINPLIYGISGGSPASGAVAFRIGGNRLTRHNWELGTTNTGSDWFFENVKESGGPFEWLAKSRANPGKTAIVVPTIGWVAKDEKSAGFPLSKLGKQAAHDPNRPEAGNGVRDGKAIAPGAPTETSVAAPPELIGRWIARVRKEDEAAGARAAAMYILDNEPDLWHVTHRDVHPEPLSYDELLDRTIRYGSAVRAADPQAVIAGPASWGWTGYFYSPLDQTGGGLLPNPDRRRHGDLPLIAYYLKKLAEHEQQTKTRVLDVLDVHYYPQADGVCQGGARTDAATAALRLRATRSLWDPTYGDESWIRERVNLIPRLKEWVQAHYPGRGISLGEWSFCAEGDISGGLAIAEALGRFGQQGLTAAFHWGNIAADTPAFWAYRAYRNFDGKGARFLDQSLPAAGTENVSLFASRDPAGSKLVAIVVNRDAAFAADVEIDVTSCGGARSQRLFAYAAGYSGLSEKPTPAPGRLLRGNVPPYALAVFEATLEQPAR
jgi:hypothetical protein